MNIARLLNQALVYWPPGTVDRYGNTDWADGSALSCRWQDSGEVFLNENGEKELSASVVFLNGVESVELDGRMYLGPLSDLGSILDDPTTVASLRIVSIDDIPSVDAAQSLKTVYLK